MANPIMNFFRGSGVQGRTSVATDNSTKQTSFESKLIGVLGRAAVLLSKVKDILGRFNPGQLSSQVKGFNSNTLKQSVDHALNAIKSYEQILLGRMKDEKVAQPNLRRNNAKRWSASKSQTEALPKEEPARQAESKFATPSSASEPQTEALPKELPKEEPATQARSEHSTSNAASEPQTEALPEKESATQAKSKPATRTQDEPRWSSSHPEKRMQFQKNIPDVDSAQGMDDEEMDVIDQLFAQKFAQKESEQLPEKETATQAKNEPATRSAASQLQTGALPKEELLQQDKGMAPMTSAEEEPWTKLTDDIEQVFAQKERENLPEKETTTQAKSESTTRRAASEPQREALPEKESAAQAKSKASLRRSEPRIETRRNPDKAESSKQGAERNSLQQSSGSFRATVSQPKTPMQQVDIRNHSDFIELPEPDVNGGYDLNDPRVKAVIKKYADLGQDTIDYFAREIKDTDKAIRELGPDGYGTEEYNNLNKQGKYAADFLYGNLERWVNKARKDQQE